MWTVLNYSVGDISPVAYGLATMIDNNRILVLGGKNEKNFDQATSILINIGSSPSYESQKLDHWNVETFRQSY